MYSTTKGLVLGFHGCDLRVRDGIISSPKETVRPSMNVYDWLGSGAYFWENDEKRALEFATYLRDNPPRSTSNRISDPTVLGAVIDPGFCFDLLRRENLVNLREFFDHMVTTASMATLPHNRKLRFSNDFILRDLDCHIINEYRKFRESEGYQPFDSVRGVFWEGNELYPDAGFKEKNHIQLCIINPNCIKGFFIPRELNLSSPRV
jgi:hypothetical protein